MTDTENKKRKETEVEPEESEEASEVETVPIEEEERPPRKAVKLAKKVTDRARQYLGPKRENTRWWFIRTIGSIGAYQEMYEGMIPFWVDTAVLMKRGFKPEPTPAIFPLN